VRFDAGSGSRLGVIEGDRIADLTAADPVAWSADLAFIPRSGDSALGRMKRTAASAPAVELNRAKLLAPVPAPSKIICVGQNYMDHIREQKAEVPTTPILFSKAPSSLVGPGDPVRWPAGLTTQADPEVEVGVVIGRTMKGVPAAQALDFIFGYTVLNDVSARDLQFGDKQWVRGKSLDTFCPVGPVLVTRDEIPDPQNLRLSCSVSGRVWQDSSTKEMIFPIAALLSFICQGITLLPGDLIATGTPHGVGAFQKPPVYLQAGDTMRLEVERIGVLENPVTGGT